MPLIDQLKQRMFQAMKAGLTIEKEVVRTVLGEVTATGQDPTDEHVERSLRKVIKGIRDTLAAETAAPRRQVLEQEIAELERFLPKEPTVEELVQLLAPTLAQIQAAGSEGPAVGLAMKHLKANGVTAAAPNVTLAVRQLRA